MNAEERLAANFCCPKCRGKMATTRTVKLTRGLPKILSPGEGRYILVSCALCGFTEMYNVLAFQKCEEQVPEGKPVPHQP
ncbi:MAG: hypothetical protein D6691_08625 [Candidatus Hydrogenedentota bacterium]|nr:MAG: hypothetical protein D6691_08625 [Candidatus Hydrogenedentota bacterium]